MKLNSNRLNDSIIKDKRIFGAFFLGFGLAVFLMNLSTLISLMPHIKAAGIEMNFQSMKGYYISLTSSFLIMAYATYNILKK